MTLGEFVRWAGYLTTVASAAMLARLLWIGLAWKYAWLFGYLLADVVESVLVIGQPSYTLWYGYVYVTGQTVKVILTMGLSIRLWVLALQTYPALARFGRRIAIYMLLGAMGLATAGFLLEPPRSGYQGVLPHYFNAFEGAADSMILLFLVAATLFLLWFPVEVSRNVAAVIGGFVVYSLQSWAGLLLVNLYPNFARDINAVVLGVELGCLLFWILAVRAKGENVRTVTGHRWNPSETERLVGQLNAINTRLTQIAK